MREIKFRGLQKGGKFAYGKLLSDGAIGRWGNSNTYNYADVDPASVGQYTGLKDKNGLDIYEGDIVRGIVKDVHDIFDEKDFTLLDEVGVVKMKEGMWMLSNDKDEYAEGMLYRYDSIEVIGNIHQNPELIASLNK